MGCTATSKSTAMLLNPEAEFMVPGETATSTEDEQERRSCAQPHVAVTPNEHRRGLPQQVNAHERASFYPHADQSCRRADHVAMACSASSQKLAVSSRAGLARARRADCPAHACMSCTLPVACPWARIAAVRPRWTG